MTYFPSHTSRKSEPAISRNRRTGRVILKLKEFKVLTKGSSRNFIFFRMYPMTMTRKIGIVALRLKIRLSIVAPL